MKVEYLQTKYKAEYKITEKLIDYLKKNFDKNSIFAIYSSVQFLDIIPKITEIVKKEGFKIITSQPQRAQFKSQILGCDSYFDNLKLKLQVDAFLYIGDGKFHPYALLFAQENMNKIVPIITYNPIRNEVECLEIGLVEANLKKRRGNLAKFHLSDEIGVFVSSKWGQEHMKSALKLKKMYPKKKFYYFVSDSFLEVEMDNFPSIKCFVNTACPRIGQDDVLRQKKAVINIKDVWIE